MKPRPYIAKLHDPPISPRMMVDRTHPIPIPLSETRRSPAEGDEVAGADVSEGSALASTVTTTTEGVAVEVALCLLDPEPEPDVEGVEEVGVGVFSEE
jgi:hypothetical protein